MEKKTRGGARPGAGRKKGEPTGTISFRVPEKDKKTLFKLIKELIARFYGK